MTSSITVRGGSPATRQKILYDRSNEVILKFLQEGHSNPTPIQYTLTPVWQILGELQEYRVQATNLKYYFDGFLNFGCDYQKGMLAIETPIRGGGDYSSKILWGEPPQY
jgi:hypothetical protein